MHFLLQTKGSATMTRHKRPILTCTVIAFVNLHFADVAMNRQSGRNDMNSVGIAPPASKMHVTNAYMSMLSYGTAGQYAASP